MANAKISQLSSIATVSNDDVLPIVDTSETATKKISISQIRSNMSRSVNEITVGANGQYATLKEAVDWFNASATADTLIRLDAGHHLVAATVHVHNASYGLTIMGAGSNNTFVDATNALTNAPMFNIASACDINRITMDGSLATGTHNGITFDEVAGIYSEITNIIIDNFTIGVADLIGVDLFLFNFLVLTCTTGVLQDYAGTPATSTTLDIEVGNFEHCTTGIHLLHGGKCNFIIIGVVFKQLASPAATAILYDGTQYIVAEITNIFNCTWNNKGTFRSGFNFTLARDAQIVFLGNVGTEDSTPHAKVNLIDTTAATTVTTTGTYYPLVGFYSKYRVEFNVAATGGTWTITYGDETTSALAYNIDAATLKTAVEALTGVTTCACVLVTTSKVWTIEFTTAGEGFLPMSVNITGLGGATLAYVVPSFYTCKFAITNNKYTLLTEHPQDIKVWVAGTLITNGNPARVMYIGVRKNGVGPIFSRTVVRSSGAGIYCPFAFSAYLDGYVDGDYFELCVTTSNSGDTITPIDLTMLIESR